MNILVIGCGRLGVALATLLDERGHDVVIVDSREELFSHLPDEFGGQTVCGMPMDVDVLREAGIENADAVAVVTADDNLNITISQVAREFFHLQNVVARIGDPARESVFTAFGLRTVCPTKMAADSVYQALLSPWEPRRLTFGTATVSFRTWQAVGPAVGMPVGEAPRFPGERVFGVVHADGAMELYNAAEKRMLAAGDHIIFVNVID